ncbi:cilia- and flagella-associated protein 100 [Mastacembelus armatus]|uniref:cilia- and flagella-associated protein 100 n=1 Tax=Mastacembelus armatus TaxID=205130 RepID=UPI000E4659E7|nr:cilia- and flagella-associated protein 100 [Mastacembelus armatus]
MNFHPVSAVSFEQEAKSKQEKDAEIKRLSAEIGTIKGELAKLEEVLIDYKRYKEFLFKLSPPTWQEAQKAKTLKMKVLSDRDSQDMQNREPEDSASSNGKYFNQVQVLENKVSSPGRELPSIRDIRLSSAHSNTL